MLNGARAAILQRPKTGPHQDGAHACADAVPERRIRGSGAGLGADGYLIKKVTMAMVNRAIVVIKILWPQRAKSPSIVIPVI
jgi:hypothetical protein